MVESARESLRLVIAPQCGASCGGHGAGGVAAQVASGGDPGEAGAALPQPGIFGGRAGDGEVGGKRGASALHRQADQGRRSRQRDRAHRTPAAPQAGVHGLHQDPRRRGASHGAARQDVGNRRPGAARRSLLDSRPQARQRPLDLRGADLYPGEGSALSNRREPARVARQAGGGDRDQAFRTRGSTSHQAGSSGDVALRRHRP